MSHREIVPVDGNKPGQARLYGTRPAKTPGNATVTVTNPPDAVPMLGSRSHTADLPSQMVRVEIAPGDVRKFHRDDLSREDTP